MGKKVNRARARLQQGKFTVPSPSEVKASEVGCGGFTAMTLAGWGVPWPPPKGWREALEERYFELGGYPPGVNGNESDFPVLTADFIAIRKRVDRSKRQRVSRPPMQASEPRHIPTIPDGEMPW